MLCYAMLHYAMLRYTMLYSSLLYYAMLYDAVGDLVAQRALGQVDPLRHRHEAARDLQKCPSKGIRRQTLVDFSRS